MQNKVAIVMGSDSDLNVMQEAAKILEQFNVPFELTVVSAHRTPERMYQFAKTAHEKNIRVIIAGAGGSAHLPGMIASLTHLPVIGVPVQSKALKGIDSLLSIVQMPAGVPVATVAINGAANAALLAVEILAIANEDLSMRIVAYKQELRINVEQKAGDLEKKGWEKYLEDEA